MNYHMDKFWSTTLPDNIIKLMVLFIYIMIIKLSDYNPTDNNIIPQTDMRINDINMSKYIKKNQID